MKTTIIFLLLLLPIWAGDFDDAADQPGSKAISLDDPRIRGWAEAINDYQPGEDLDEPWQSTNKGLGPATGDPFDIVGLGRGGTIEFVWLVPLLNGPGPDIAIFENSFSDRFLELAHVEVSSDGINWQRFPSISQTTSTVGSFGDTDPTKLSGLAGKYRATFGTGFDFSHLPENPLVDPESIRFIRLIDVVGDGTDLDSLGNPIYDPFPTFGSAGFDLDGIAILGPPPLSLLRTVIEENAIVFKWTVEPGKEYFVESSPALTPESWQILPVFTARNRVSTHRAPRGNQGFFRLAEKPAE